MNKKILILVLSIAFLIVGCSNKDETTSKETKPKSNPEVSTEENSETSKKEKEEFVVKDFKLDSVSASQIKKLLSTPVIDEYQADEVAPGELKSFKSSDLRDDHKITLLTNMYQDGLMKDILPSIDDLSKLSIKESNKILNAGFGQKVKDENMIKKLKDQEINYQDKRLPSEHYNFKPLIQKTMHIEENKLKVIGILYKESMSEESMYNDSLIKNFTAIVEMNDNTMFGGFTLDSIEYKEWKPANYKQAYWEMLTYNNEFNEKFNYYALVDLNNDKNLELLASEEIFPEGGMTFDLNQIKAYEFVDSQVSQLTENGLENISELSSGYVVFRKDSSNNNLIIESSNIHFGNEVRDDFRVSYENGNFTSLEMLKAFIRNMTDEGEELSVPEGKYHYNGKEINETQYKEFLSKFENYPLLKWNDTSNLSMNPFSL